jgi:hypothetical protein
MFRFIKKALINYFTFFFLLMIFVASTYYFFQRGFFLIHDYTIGVKIVEMASGLRSLEWPVRWSAELGYGFGMPLFNFYAPLPYFFGAIFYLLGFNLVVSIKFLYLLVTLITLIGAFKLGKRLSGNWGGIILAGALTLAPYRALNIFVRGALSEVFAMAFFPWVILAIYQIIDSKENENKRLFKAYLLLFVSLSAIILSHNLSALMFIPLAFLWAIFIAKRKQLWSIIKVFSLSFFATAFYTLPSFLEKNLTKIDTILTGYFDYHLHFLYIRQFFQDNWGYGGSGYGANDDISFFLGYGQLLALFLLGVLFLAQLFRAFKNHDLKKFFIRNKILFLAGFITVFCLFLSIGRSLALWETLKVLSFIQFPWRWLGSASFFLAMFLAIGSGLLKKDIWQKIILSFLFLTFFFNAQFFKAEKVLSNSELYYYSDKQLISSEMSKTLPDYIPKQMADELTLQDYNKKYPEASVWLNQNSTDNLIFKSQLLKSKNQSQDWKISLSEISLINFKIANFIGWTAYVDNKKAPIIENQKLGNVQLLVPVGEHLVSLRFQENNLRLISDYISLVSLLIFIFWLITLKNKSTNQ